MQSGNITPVQSLELAILASCFRNSCSIDMPVEFTASLHDHASLEFKSLTPKSEVAPVLRMTLTHYQAHLLNAT